MIALISADDTLVVRVERLLGTDDLVVTDRWLAARRGVHRCDAGLLDLDLPGLTPGELRDWTRRPLTPPMIGLVRAFRGPALELIAAGSLYGIVPLAELNRLPVILRQAHAGDVLTRLGDRVSADRHLPRALRRALGEAVSRRVPFRTVEALAAAVHIHPSTLFQELRRSRAEMGLKEILDWILLLQARAVKLHGRSWKSVAHALETPMRTLQRASRRCAGVSLTEFERQSLDTVLAYFEATVVEPLCAPACHRSDVDSPEVSSTHRGGDPHGGPPAGQRSQSTEEDPMPKARVVPAKVDLREIPVRELEAELAKSRILAAAAQHIVDRGVDLESISFSLDFSLDW